jgi:hypothetical protein
MPGVSSPLAGVAAATLASVLVPGVDTVDPGVVDVAGVAVVGVVAAASLAGALPQPDASSATADAAIASASARRKGRPGPNVRADAREDLPKQVGDLSDEPRARPNSISRS